MTEPLNHKLDVSKIKTLTDVKNVFECMSLYANASEEHEQYELLKEYFTIPNEPQELVGFKLPRKSLEEITQEFDEKIDKQIEDVEYKFAQLKHYQEYQYNQKFQRIEDNFQHLKNYGCLPIITFGTGIGVNNITSNFVIKSGGKEVGFYTFGNGYLKYYMDKKPTAIVRFFMNKLLGFRWEDT
jgi:hypothetical protein